MTECDARSSINEDIDNLAVSLISSASEHLREMNRNPNHTAYNVANMSVSQSLSIFGRMSHSPLPPLQ